MSPQVEIAVAELSQVGEVRRVVTRLCQQSGFTETKQAEAAIVATELATNLIRHAKSGRVLIQKIDLNDTLAVELLALDSGPGMADVQRCLQDGYSTAGTSGNGLGAVRRLADDFDIFSLPGQGTVIVARVSAETSRSRKPATLEWGAVSIPAPNELVCGDAWAQTRLPDSFSLMIADGLGHGPAAHEAATQATTAFAANSSSQPREFMQAAHRALQGTRGAALAVARWDAQAGKLQYCGVGNIAGTIITDGKSRGLMSHNGIVGAQSPRILQVDCDCPARSLLIMHSDGLQTRWRLEDYPGLVTRHPAIIASVLYRDFVRGRDDATVVVVRLSEGNV